MVLKATSVMFSGEFLTTLVLFARNILVARLISVEDFGIAATFSILFAVIEMISNMSLNKLIVQSPHGNEERFQDTLQAMQMARGVIGAVLTLLLAYPYAAFVKTPDLVWAYQMLALIPLVRGAMHLDIYRVQRRMDFAPFAITNAASPLVGLVVVLLVYLVSPDYQIMLWAIIAQQIAAVVLSHVFAERRFRLAWDTAYLRQSISFGLPLLLNGVVLVAITNGERMIVANQLDLVTLAWFSAAFLLATAPTRILSNTANGIFLPKLSACNTDPEAFRRMSLLAIEVLLYLGLCAAVALALLGPLLLVGLFGAAYAPGIEVLVILGVGQAIRIARVAPNSIAMADGRTDALFYAGLVRIGALPVAYVALAMGHDVRMLALIALGFEILCFAYGLLLAARRQHVPLRPEIPALTATAVVLGLILLDLRLHPPTGSVLDPLHPMQGLIVGATVVALLAMPRIWRGGLAALRWRAPAE